MEMPDVDIDTEASKRKRIIEATCKKYGYDRVLNICTFKTEGSKSSILTAARGLGIDNDIAQYIANLIPVVRGATTSLSVMVYGDEENNIKPNTQFIDECNQYPKLLETAMEIEGLVCGRSIHASGVIIFDDNFNEYNCCMKAPNGQLTTQWNMDDSTYCGGLKFDYLTITNLDAMHLCLDMLVKYGYIEWQGSLRATYDKYFHPDVIDYETIDMWLMAEQLKIVNLFQFQTQVGGQAIKRIKPRNLLQLGVANSVMRLMGGEDADEQPIDTYIRYKNDINEWYECMEHYGLTKEEQYIVENYLLPVSGMATMQEEVMKLVMEKHISNFSMTEANKLRKSIAKKKKKLQEEAKKMFYSKGEEEGTSINLLDYVWNECITPQLGYSFSLPHVLGYSTIAVQEMNMAYHYPLIYWNCANLIVDSAADEDSIGGATNYGKIASAIANMQQSGAILSLPLINEAEFGFIPDEKNNRIICSLKSLNGIGDEVALSLINNRPYTSMQDFYDRMIKEQIIGYDVGTDGEQIPVTQPSVIKTGQMVRLIKAGCFTELDNKDRLKTMEHYLRNYVFAPCKKLTMMQLSKMIDMGCIPDEFKLIPSLINFKTYVLDDEGLYDTIVIKDKKIPKCGYHDRQFLLDECSMKFFKEHFSEESIIKTVGENYVVSEKLFLKEVEKLLSPFKEWMALDTTLELYNESLFNQTWEKYASGSLPHWEMESLSFYYTEHELKNININKYSIASYNELPEEPVPYDFYTRWIKGERKQIPKFQITRLAGTVLDTDKNKHMITLLTTDGTVVTCKFNKGQFAHYNKQISVINEDGSKTVVDKNWFSRGQLVLVCGYRDGDMFRAYRYADTLFTHTVVKIEKILDNGDLLICTERARTNE